MYRIAIRALAVLLFVAPAAAGESGLIEKRSNHSVAETADRLETALEEKGLKVFARIDHAAAAADYGEELPALVLVIFGNPKSGTAMMQKAPTAGIDLPLKAIVYENKNGEVWLAYNSADEVMDEQLARHGLSFTAEQKAPIAAMLDSVTSQAVE